MNKLPMLEAIGKIIAMLDYALTLEMDHRDETDIGAARYLLIELLNRNGQRPINNKQIAAIMLAAPTLHAASKEVKELLQCTSFEDQTNHLLFLLTQAIKEAEGT